MISLVLQGAAGRMGRTVLETAAAAPGFKIKGCVDRVLPPWSQGDGRAWGTELGRFVGRGDVVVDFSVPEAAVEAARCCAGVGAALVSGTTSLVAEQEEAMRVAGRTVAVLHSSNFSLGVAALRGALKAVLPGIPDWDIEIVERHHRDKADSPSGTALQLAREAAQCRGYDPGALRHGRQGRLGRRPAAEIGVHALRGGSWVGDHTVILAGPGESIELRHVAQDRTAFARGALAAAGFVVNAAPGLYTLDHVLSAAVR
ncbi:MAG TPA: 4-hydroxy-tetrahydrodipicolinate reductase [Candidatus Eisenbacteria bacterium]|jgi:4-hydroxy-tetrahydrodipicolinate reductase